MILQPLPVGIVCDLAEERWPSMDLIGDMLIDRLPAVSRGRVAPARLQPTMPARCTRLPVIKDSSRALLADRLAARLWDYPRWLSRRASEFRVFHIVDHSYAHLTRVLPRRRTVVTCHDVDAFHASLATGGRPFTVERLLARRVLGGLAAAEHVTCVSEATRAQLLATGAIDPHRVSVVYEGVHPSCTPNGAQPRFHTGRTRTILHVGSTVQRKRIDLLLDIFARLRRSDLDLRLVRVGGPLTPEQRAHATGLGVLDAVTEMPRLSRDELADAYRQAAILLLPSDREGFGLPLVEAMACGTPVVASDIPALKEIGGDAGVYCRPGAVEDWVTTVQALLEQHAHRPDEWHARQETCIRHAARFSWDAYAAELTKIYVRLSSQ